MNIDVKDILTCWRRKLHPTAVLLMLAEKTPSSGSTSYAGGENAPTANALHLAGFRFARHPAVDY